MKKLFRNPFDLTEKDTHASAFMKGVGEGVAQIVIGYGLMIGTLVIIDKVLSKKGSIKTVNAEVILEDDKS